MKNLYLLLLAYIASVCTVQAQELTGRDLFNDQMAKKGYVRLHNKRTATAYLTSSNPGRAVGARRVTEGYSQVWKLEEPKAYEYTLRNAETGEYLQGSFASPGGTASTLYIQFSPNNTGSEAYVNISSNPAFTGNTCLNLGQDGTTLYQWSYAGDAGSDWAIELAEDVTDESIVEYANQKKGYVPSITDGAYYRIVSTSYDLAMTESEGGAISLQVDPANVAQYWKLTKAGTGYRFQNALTDNYIQKTSSYSVQYTTAKNAVILYPRRISDTMEYRWVIANDNNGSNGLHTATTQGNRVVLWYTSAEASQWAFVEATISQEEIDAARAEYSKFTNLVENKAAYQTHLDNLFQDKACTVLKADIQALTDEALAANEDFAALNADMQAMVLKVKNDTWQQFTNKSTGYSRGYEKFFRIADYQIYSNHQEMASRSNFEMSNAFGRLSGPTGIYANAGDIVYIYVDEAPKSECSLAVELVPTDGVGGNHPTGTQTTLTQGLNLLRPGQQVMIYIFHQLNNTRKYLADYPDIKVHIEGGQLNGYWDATRGMTNADWKLLQQDLLTAPFVNLKTKHLVFQMNTDIVKKAEPNEMEGLMRIWEMIPTNEDRYMGVEDFEGRYNNIWNVFNGASSYMHSTTHGTWYSDGTIPTVMNYANMRKPGNLWGPSHEIGHNHQNSINVIGTTESSNNLFSNINTFEQGIQDSRRQLPCDVFLELAKGTPWVSRNIWQTTSMFFQLYLYFHAQHHDDEFLPNLFRTMRKNPINKWSGTGGTGPTSYGKDDYLHLAKMICDVAKADLSEFFEAYGMFVPIDKVAVDDYSHYTVTTTQAHINSARRYMQKYPKKLGNIMFIDDHVKQHKADPNNKFEGLPTGTYRAANLSQHTELGNAYNAGSVGDYEEFDGNPDYTADADYFTIASDKVTFRGKGFIGHKFYDTKGNLIWATSETKNVALPAALKSLDPVKDYYVVAAQANMEDVPCPYYSVTKAKNYTVDVYFGAEGKKKEWRANGQTDLAAYLPDNAIGVVTTAGAPENVTGAANIIADDNTAKCIVIDGTLPFYLPADVAADSLAFTMQNSGYAALRLPFALSSTALEGLQVADYTDQVLTLIPVDEAPAGQPVVVSGKVAINLGRVNLTAGDFQPQENILVLSADGQSVETAETAAPFLFPMQDATAVRSIAAGTGVAGTASGLYDLSGRSLGRVAQPGLYIMGGRKVIVR